MLAVGLGQHAALAEMAALDDPTLSLAAVNSATQVTIAGSAAGIERLRLALDARRIFARALNVQVPFHSVFMEPLEAPIHAALAGLKPMAPAIPLYSTVTGARVAGAIHDADYWYRNIRQPVCFADAVNAALDAGYRNFAELSPHPVLGGALQEGAILNGIAANVVPTLRRGKPEAMQVRIAVGTLFCLGVCIDWAGALEAGIALPLPCYQWRHERHWYETAASADNRSAAPLHPILSRRLDAEMPTWEADLDRLSLDFLQDHCIQGTVVFPGAAYVEMAAFAARSLFGDLATTTFANIAFRRALYISPDQAVTLRISVDPETCAFRIASRLFDQPGAAWQLHCTGQLLTGQRGQDAPARLADIQQRCGTAVTAAACYAHFERLGLEYGPLFQGISSLQQGAGEALAWVDVPAALLGTMGQFGIHPALLDLCFQTLAAALPFDGGAATVYMPTGVAEGRILHALPQQLWIHASIGRRDAHGMLGDIRMFDGGGRLLLEIAGCSARALGAAAPFAVTPQKLYQPSWIASAPVAATPAAAAPGCWYLYGGEPALAQAVAAQFAQRGHSAFSLDAGFDATSTQGWLDQLTHVPSGLELRGVLHLDLCRGELPEAPAAADIDAEIARGCLVTLNLTQALAALPGVSKPRLWIVTRGTQPVLGADRPDPFRAPVWGMARVLGHGEHIDLWGGIVDLPAQPHDGDARCVVDECLGGDAEDQIAYRGEVRHVLRLAECEQAVRLPTAPRLRADASYLVTGGLGALGLEVSRWMVGCGAAPPGADRARRPARTRRLEHAGRRPSGRAARRPRARTGAARRPRQHRGDGHRRPQRPRRAAGAHGARSAAADPRRDPCRRRRPPSPAEPDQQRRLRRRHAGQGDGRLEPALRAEGRAARLLHAVLVGRLAGDLDGTRVTTPPPIPSSTCWRTGAAPTACRPPASTGARGATSAWPPSSTC